MENHAQTVDPALLSKAALQLFQEAYVGPPSPDTGTWFVDNEPDCGLLGTLRTLTAEQASTPLSPGASPTVAAHVGHLLFALSLANGEARGEEAAGSWSQSWDYRKVDAVEWRRLCDRFEREIAAFRQELEGGRVWASEEGLTGALAVIAHGAWHLGAIRQGLNRVRLPEGSAEVD